MTKLKERRLGRTGLMVTELGLGAMDTSQVLEGHETLNLALDMGINFVDTAREYQGSEYLIGEVVRERETKAFYIATKTFSRSSDGAQYDVDRSLRVLGDLFGKIQSVRRDALASTANPLYRFQ